MPAELIIHDFLDDFDVLVCSGQAIADWKNWNLTMFPGEPLAVKAEWRQDRTSTVSKNLALWEVEMHDRLLDELLAW